MYAYPVIYLVKSRDERDIRFFHPALGTSKNLHSIKGEADYFSRNFVYILRTTATPHNGKFHRFLFPFASKFPDLNFAPYVLYS